MISAGLETRGMMLKKIGIHLKEQLVKDVTKSAWKKVVKDAVGSAFDNQVNQEKTRKKTSIYWTCWNRLIHNRKPQR